VKVLAGRAALVTGGARGIGRAIAEMLVREGVAVALADIDLATAQATADALRRPGCDVAAYALDVREPEGWAQVVAAMGDRLGPPTILVNNAGIMSLGSLTDQPRDADRRQLDINVVGVIEGMRAVLPTMRRLGQGHIVNIASVAGKVGIPHAAVYSATKFAVAGLTDAVRHEERGRGIAFTTVHPSLVQTELIAGTGRPRFPPPATVEQVADAVREALLHEHVHVYVPRIGRLAALAPAWLGRRLSERVGRLLGMDTMFATVDAGRAAYRARTERS